MKTRKRTEITCETSRTVIVKRSGRLWCQLCLAETEMITPETAATMLNISTREIYRWIELGELHFVERPETALLICTTSLSRVTKENSCSRSNSNC
jgi:hypothetical protein